MKNTTLLEQTINEAVSHSNASSYWGNSKFEPIVKLTNDERGKWGESYVYALLKDLVGLDVGWDEDANTDADDGTYDVYVNSPNGKIRIEVKTSGRTVAKGKPIGWQHENVYYHNNLWDKLFIVDYDSNPDVIYLTILDHDEIVKDGQLDLTMLGKKGHNRKDVAGKSKVDFSSKTLRLGVEKGLTFVYNVNDPDNEGLTYFLLDKLQ